MAKVERIPASPGVYLMKDNKGEVIYVGKAASLRQRVRSYFRNEEQQLPKVRALVTHIEDIDCVLTDNAVEALILECNLIKKYHPRYNVALKDDKHYPYLRVTVQDIFPRVETVRSMKKDGARYFGPYTNGGALRSTLRLCRRLFPLRTCSDVNLHQVSRPCLDAHIGRCLAPCSGQVSRDEYGQVVKDLLLFLEGHHSSLLSILDKRMWCAAEDMDFEKAADLRDQLAAVAGIMEQQKIISSDQQDQDIIGLAAGEGQVCIGVFLVRGGKVVGRDHFFLRVTEEWSPEEAVTAFVQQYYSLTEFVPPLIFLPVPVEENELVSQWLRQKRGTKVRLVVPRRGEKKRLVELVEKNADALLQEELAARRAREADDLAALEELKRELDLSRLPMRIEGYDISNLQGTNQVGSMVVFQGGKPQNSSYRRFQIRSVQGPDDYASLQDVLARRFRKAGEERQGLPDLVLVDGGRGQANAAAEVLAELGVVVPLIGLAKEEEVIFLPGSPKPLFLSRHSPGLKLLQRVRDEAHRFALGYHRLLREKDAVRSAVDEIPGIGPRRKKALLQKFGSLKGIRAASLEELSAVPGMTRKAAESVKDFLGTSE